MSVPPSGAGEATRQAALGVWALLLGMGLLMLANGLQGSLLGIRAANEGFGSAVTGLVMTGYFLGFLAGSTLTPIAVRHVGHVRVFAALASMASIAILVHSLWVIPSVWGLMRFLTGLAYAGLYVVSESWLNDRAGNTQRGGLLSIYMVVSYGGMAGGHLLLNAADPNAFGLFILTSIIVSFALIPILLSATTQPGQHSVPDRIGLIRLFHISPLGVAGAVVSGVAQGTIFSMGAVYARTAGLSVAQVSVFMSLFILGAALFQWPLGRLSDRMDRRRVIAASAFAAAALAPVAGVLAGISIPGLMLSALLLGGAILTLYSIIIAHTNDYLEPRQMVAASGTLVLATGIGALLGPSATGLLMDWLGPNGFWAYLCAIHLGLGGYTLYRMHRTPMRGTEDQSQYVGMPGSTGELAETWVEEVESAGETASEEETPEHDRSPPDADEDGDTRGDPPDRAG